MAATVSGDMLHTWIEKIESGEEILLSNFQEIADQFSGLDFNEILPVGLIDIKRGSFEF